MNYEEVKNILITSAVYSDNYLIVKGQDVPEIHVPWNFHSSLATASPEQRRNFRILFRGSSLNWPELDLDFEYSNFFSAVDEGYRAYLREESRKYTFDFNSRLLLVASRYCSALSHDIFSYENHKDDMIPLSVIGSFCNHVHIDTNDFLNQVSLCRF